MTRYWRDGHRRAGRYGPHWVEGHWVDRSEWVQTSYSLGASTRYVYRPRQTYENFTRPTVCSYCGATVFFIKHNGGSVFFNRLGWPWDDKHACRSPYPSAMISKPLVERERPLWQEQGWNPIEIEKIYREDEWFVLKCKTLEDQTLIRVLVAADPGDICRMPAMLGGWSTNGFASLIFLNDDVEAKRLLVARYDKFILETTKSVIFPVFD